MSMIDELKSLSVGEVFTDDVSLKKAACDASLFEVLPRAIVAPRSEGEVAKLVRAVAQRKAIDPALSLTVRAAGTGMDGGALTESIVVDVTKYLHSIGELRQVDSEWRIDVEPGVYYRDLEKVLAPQGLMLPSYTASKDLCTLGGMVANNASGYFLWDVWDGTHFDIAKLIVGSQGTLGIMTRIELALVPVPKSEQALVITLNTLDALPELVLALRSENASRIEAFDENTYALAAEHMPEATSGIITTAETSLTVIATLSGDDIASVAARCTRAHDAVTKLA